jgi:hypothetical protein
MEVLERVPCSKLHVVIVVNQLDRVVLEVWEQGPCSELHIVPVMNQ